MSLPWPILFLFRAPPLYGIKAPAPSWGTAAAAPPSAPGAPGQATTATQGGSPPGTPPPGHARLPIFPRVFLKPAESSRYAVALLVLIPKRLPRLCVNFVLGNTDPHRSLVPSDHRPQDRHEPLKACGLSRNPHCSSCKGWRFSSEDPHWGCISFSLEEGARYLGDRNRTVKSTGKRTRYESTDSQPSLRIRDCVERVDINACACVCACVLIVHCISCLGIEAVQVVGLNK